MFNLWMHLAKSYPSQNSIWANVFLCIWEQSLVTLLTKESQINFNWMIITINFFIANWQKSDVSALKDQQGNLTFLVDTFNLGRIVAAICPSGKHLLTISQFLKMQ